MKDYYLIGERIREVRRRKYTQRELANELGCNPQTVSDIERHGTLSIKTLINYADALDTAPQFLLPFSWLKAHHRQQDTLAHIFYLAAQVQDEEFLLEIEKMLENHIARNNPLP